MTSLPPLRGGSGKAAAGSDLCPVPLPVFGKMAAVVARCRQHTEDIKSHREQAPMPPLRSCMQHLQGSEVAWNMRRRDLQGLRPWKRPQGKLTGKETSQMMKEFLTMQTEMLSTLKSFQATLKPRDSEAHSSKDASSQESFASSRRYRADVLKYPLPHDSEEECDSEVPNQEVSDEGVVDSQEEDGREESRSSRHIFSADDMEDLLKAIYASEEIQEPAAQ
ncbi:hypothetical protein AB205_0011110, partial [Aquarana catesbeiana]